METCYRQHKCRASGFASVTCEFWVRCYHKDESGYWAERSYLVGSSADPNTGRLDPIVPEVPTSPGVTDQIRRN